MAADAYHKSRPVMTAAPAGCPVHDTFTPLSAEYLADPYPLAAQLRDEMPVFFAPTLGYVVTGRMADVEAVFTDSETYSSGNVQDPVYPLCDEARAVLAVADYNPVAVLSNKAEPDHGRIRTHAMQGFSNRRMKLLEPYIRRRADELLDGILAGPRPTDFIRSFAFPLPGETVFRLIGFPESDDELLKSWCRNRKAFSWGRPSPDEQVAIAESMLAYWRYCREFVADKHRHPGDDLASELLAVHDASSDELSYREVESVVYALSFAGHETVTALLGNCILALLSRRDQWAELCGDPTLIPNAVEEVLRFESAQVSWRRITTRPAELGGITLEEGTPILLHMAAANRDPALFSDPDRFDIHRQNARMHISFGKGIHFCLGARLARVEARIMLEAIAERVPTLRLVDDQVLTRFPNITFRGPEVLLVDWDGLVDWDEPVEPRGPGAA